MTSFIDKWTNVSANVWDRHDNQEFRPLKDEGLGCPAGKSPRTTEALTEKVERAAEDIKEEYRD